MSYRLIAGLGNPGKEYERTRHNAGFLVLDQLAPLLGKSLGLPEGDFRLVSRWSAETLRLGSVCLLKPMTYMNASGEAVVAAMRFYKIPAEEILVVQDDLDLPLGTLRFRSSGSAGGHNGIKSIINHLGTNAFHRLKVGIGRTDHQHEKVIGHVLGDFRSHETALADRLLGIAAKAVLLAHEEGLQKAMNRYQGHHAPPEED
ncbi:MAG: aminoacyl-tRNA hydrolase [Verrucomicrobiota bacterium]